MKRIAVLIFTMWSISANAGNWATCILDKMPGSKNDAVTTSVYSQCKSDYPDGLLGIRKGSGRGLFGYKDGNTCIQKEASDTVNSRGSFGIATACRCLYAEATFDNEMCAYPPVPNQNFYVQ